MVSAGSEDAVKEGELDDGDGDEGCCEAPNSRSRTKLIGAHSLRAISNEKEVLTRWRCGQQRITPSSVH